MTDILIVDDDPKIRSLLRRYLDTEGIGVEEAGNADEAYKAFENQAFDLILMDLNMPGEGGLEITRKIRATSAIPIIIVTGKDDPVDKAIGLEVGADDYVSKPFHLREVLARINSVLRRVSATQPPKPSQPDKSERLSFDKWTMDFGRHVVIETKSKEKVDLTSAEFKLLKAFVENSQRVMNRDQLLDHVAGREWTPFDRTIDTQVRRLRLKLENDPQNPDLIKTVRGEGYIFTAAAQSV